MRDLSTRELHVLKAGAFRSDHHIAEQATKSAVRALRVRELVDAHDCGCNGFVVNDYGLMVAAAHGISQRPALSPIGKKKQAAWDAAGRNPGSSFDRLDKPVVVAKNKTQASTGPKRSVCDLVDIRSGKRCEFPGCMSAQDHRHHRLNRKAGGRHGEMRERLNSAAWLLGICFTHHDAVTHPPEGMAATFERMGWILREGQDATQVEVFTRHHVDPVWLDNAGEWHLFDEAAA